MSASDGPGGAVHLFVNGTLMTGEELHGNLDGARFLGLGVVELANGQLTLGVVWLAGEVPPSFRDISEFGDWRRYRASRG